jgi:hypothetical protein
MNCQYCGKKIGIIENWRYGRFCSKEHQDEFREEASRLAASVLGARPAGGEQMQEDRAQAFSGLSAPRGVAGEAPPEPDPPRMEAMEQSGATALRWTPKPIKVNAEGRDRSAAERHSRSLRILAANDRTAPPVLEKDRRRKLSIEDGPYRFGDVEAPGARSVLVPPSGAVQKRPKLRFWDHLLPLDQEEIQAARPEFECLWDGTGEWTVEDAGPGEVEFGDYLGDYSPEQPWEQWDWDALLEEARYAQAMNEERDRRLEKLRSQQTQEPAHSPRTASGGRAQAGMPAMPAYPGHMAHVQQSGQVQQAMPGLNLAPAGMAGKVTSRPGPAPGRPATAGHGGASHGGGSAMAGGFALPAMPSYPGRMVLRPAGATGTGAAGAPGGRGGGAPGPGPLVRIVPAMGLAPVEMEWVELAPPLFLALCKIDDPEAVALPRRLREFAVEPVAGGLGRDPSIPGFTGAICAARMAGVREECEAVQMPECLAPRAFEAVDTKPAPVMGDLDRMLPAYRLAAGRRRFPAAPSGDRMSINLRPLERMARPDAGVVSYGYRGATG